MRRFSSSIKSQYTTSFQRLWSIVAILLMLVSNFGPMAATTKALAKAPSNTSGAVPAVKAETTSMALAPERLNVSQPERTIKSIEPVQKQYTGRQTTGNYGPPDNTQVLSLEPTSWGGGVCWPYCYDNTQIFHMNCAFEDDAHTVVFCTGYFEYNFYNGIVGGAASFDVYVVPFPSWNEPSWSNIPTVYYYQFRSSPNLNGKISTMCDHNCDNYGHYMKPSEEGTFYDEDPGGRYHVVALNLFYDNPPCPAG